MYARAIERGIRDALADTPAVLIVGPRQAGKSTLVQAVIDSAWTYATLDDAGTLAAAIDDPVGFVAGTRGSLAIDEVHKAPALLPAIKAAIDRARRPGRFLLTGSANVLALPRVGESLAGRVEIATLWPLMQLEIARSLKTIPFVDRIFDDAPPIGGAGSSQWRARALAGGFPEALARERADRRTAWFSSYLATVLTRDVRDVAGVVDLGALPRLTRLLATRAGGLANVADLARSLALPVTTVRRYLGVLETIFVIHPLQPWHANLGKRIVKAPKLYIVDSGLLAHLLGVLDASEPTSHDGMLFEGLAVMELVRQAAIGQLRAQCFHFRTHEGHEVDVVLEDPRGRLVGVEIKATRTPRPDDFRGLRLLATAVPDRFVRGVLLYAGDEVIPFGERLHAVPIVSLWAPARGGKASVRRRGRAR